VYLLEKYTVRDPQSVTLKKTLGKYDSLGEFTQKVLLGSWTVRYTSFNSAWNGYCCATSNMCSTVKSSGLEFEITEKQSSFGVLCLVRKSYDSKFYHAVFYDVPNFCSVFRPWVSNIYWPFLAYFEA